MGLDMYLYKKNYIRTDEFYKPEIRNEVIVKTGGEIDKRIKPERITYVIEEVGYWRKANQIHRWFVENVQNGIDECQTSWVSREKLEELLDLCKKISEDNSLAEDLLPSTSGFFFGGTEYDEYYFDCINNTIEIIEDCLSDEYGDDFEYRASW